MKNSIISLILMALFCVPYAAAAQTHAHPDSALLTILDEFEGAPLPLQQAVRHALQNATSVRLTEAAYLAARGSVRREQGRYDPEFFFELEYLDQDQPTASFFAGAPTLITQQTTSRSGLRMNLSTGAELELTMNTIRSKTNSQFAFLNPEYSTFGNLSVRQPLLGGFAASARKQLTSAERALEAEKARYDQQVRTVRAEVERAYWDLYAAERDYAVQKLTRDRAEAFLKEAEVRAQTGLIGPNQVANARTFLAEQELLLIERDEQLDRQSDQLAYLIGVWPESRQGRTRYMPVDDPPDDFPFEPVDVLVERALRDNLDLQAAQKDVEAIDALAHAAGWEALPSVDLVGSVGGAGLAGSAQDVIFGGETLRSTRGGSFGNALNQVFSRDFPSWSVGVSVSIPIGLRSGRGEQDRLEAQVLVIQQNYIERSRLLEAQVRASYRELSHGQNRLKAAKEGVEAAQEQVRIGLIEFHNGRATAFELVRLSEDFAVAQQRYSEALVRTAKAAATLRQLTSAEYTN